MTTTAAKEWDRPDGNLMMYVLWESVRDSCGGLASARQEIHSKDSKRGG